jgi:hypothetical protein
VADKTTRSGFAAPFQAILARGAHKGWQAFVWMLKILVPLSFVTMVLGWSGWIDRADFILGPLMGFLHLPAAAAVPLVAGMLTGIYGGIAAMAALPLNQSEMTLVAVFLLIAHNLIQEGVIQGKSGINPFKATAARFVAAAATVTVVGWFLPFEPSTAAAGPLAAPQPFAHVIAQWGGDTVRLIVKIFVIIGALMIFLEILKYFKVIGRLVTAIVPLLALLGLNRQVGFLWLTASVFGLAYGGAVIVEETRAGALSRPEIENLHLSIGIQHSLIEDPALFLSIGLDPFWLWVPRLIVAIAAVHLFALCKRLRPVKAFSSNIGL